METLEAAGFTVAVSINATPADRAAVEACRVQDAAARADRLDERAQRHEQAAVSSGDRYAAVRGIADGIPLSQPILVGHHSEGRARRDVARLSAHMDASVQHTTDAPAGSPGGPDRDGGHRRPVQPGDGGELGGAVEREGAG